MDRKGKGMRKSKPHKAMLRKYVEITGIVIWKQGRYRFDFENGVYSMDGQRLDMKPSEELYLYERLVLHKPPKGTVCRYAIQRLRERYGTDFLTEVIEGNVRSRLDRRTKSGYAMKGDTK
jgi:hypothetical protein